MRTRTVRRRAPQSAARGCRRPASASTVRPKSLVVRGDHRVEERARLVALLRRGNRSRRSIIVRGRPGRGDAALGEHDDVGGEPRHLGDRVADIDDRDADLVAQPLDVGQDLGLARLVERGERLVHQQEARAGEQRPADRDALLLAAGESARPAVEQRADAEQLDDVVEVARCARAAGANQRP